MSIWALAASPAETETLGEDDFTYLDPDDKTIVTGIKTEKEIPSKLEFPEGIKEIGGIDTFSGQKFESVVFPSSLKKIGMGAFKSCTNLSKVTIPGGVQICGEAFWGCTSLETVVVLYGNENNATIADLAFAYCSKLNKVELAEDVVIPESDTFANCAESLIIYADGGTKSGDYGDKLVSNKQAVDRKDLPADSEAAYKYEYKAADGKLTVEKYLGKSADPVIPAEINGKPVTNIASGAFTGNITSVTVRSTNIQEIAGNAFPNGITLRGYNGKTADYAESNSLKFENLNQELDYTVTVPEDCTDWLKFSVGEQADGSDAVGAERHTELTFKPKGKYITVWIEKMDAPDKLLEEIVAASVDTDDPNAPNIDDKDFTAKKSVFVIIAEAQSKLTESDTCVPPSLRRFTFKMPGANVKVEAVITDLGTKYVPDTPAAVGGDNQPELTAP